MVVSAFDSVRRVTARRALQRLVADGRIHPTRIEDVKLLGPTDVELALRNLQAARP